jgi:hypothetical protein
VAGAGARKRLGQSANSLVGAAVALAIASCGGSTSDVGATSSGQTACLPGNTALQPRTLAQGHFSGLELVDGVVLATGTDLQQLPLTGDPALTLTHAEEMRGLVVVGQTAYFVAGHPVGAPDAQGKQSSTTALYSAPLGGGAPTLVLDTPFNIEGAVTDGTAIYFSGYGGGVGRVAVADGSRTDLPLPPALGVNALALHAGVLYVAATDLSSASATNGIIVKIPADGGSMQPVVANIGHPWNLVADASGLFWVEDPPVGTFADSRIVRAGLDGSGARTLVPHGARALVVSGGDLYFAWDAIARVPVGGGAVTTLVSGLKAPGLLGVSKGNAVWTDPVSQALSDPTVPSLSTTCW